MKRTISVILLAFLLAFGTAPAYAADSTAVPAEKVVVSPEFTGIAVLSISLNIDAWGCATSTGTVCPSSNSYTSVLTVSLQKYVSGGWTTLKSWTDSGAGLSGVIISESYYVASGTYRARSTASVYDQYGALLDTESAYSSVQTY